MPLMESEWHQINTVQGPSAPRAATLASAATIAPTTFLTILTGNVGIQNITPPLSQGHMLAIKFAGTGGFVTGGNIDIGAAKASTAGEVTLLVYNPNGNKYIPVT